MFFAGLKENGRKSFDSLVSILNMSTTMTSLRAALTFALSERFMAFRISTRTLGTLKISTKSRRN
jgi:hypothetical protein